MFRFALISLARMMLTVVTVTFLCFAAMNIFGQPLVNIMGGAALDPERFGAEIAEVTAQYRLDDPIPVRYLAWLGDVITGDFGRSYISQQSISTVVADRLPVTVLLVVMAQMLAVAIAVPWAVSTAARQGSRWDRWSTSTSFGLIAFPSFAVGVVVFYLVVVRWQILPSRFDDTSLSGRLHSLVGPAVTLALPLMATYQQVLASELRTTLHMPFIDLARAKGVSPRRILWVHALRPASFGLLTTFGINTGALLGGSLVVEQIFTVPGVGLELIRAIDRDDFPVVLAFVVVISVAFVVASWLVDMAYSLMDPRTRSRPEIR